MQNLSNTNLGQYQLIEVIGRGRLSMVYKAYQPSLQRFVAIKVLQHLDLLGAMRFEREAQLIAQIHHPNILPIFDYGQQDDLRYFVMQYVERSVTLGDMQAHQSIEQIAALRMIHHLLAGLGYAHAHGIIHRDIKPSNILLPSPAWPLLADFGIAKLLDDLRQLTPPGQAVGTADYMAPELARGLSADHRSDLYSVGVVLYELLTGQVPFDAVTPAAVLNMHIHAAPPPPRSINQELPLEVETLLLRALAKDQAARYQSAAEMAEDVEQVVSQLERERLLAELVIPAAVSAIPLSYATRKLEPDPRSDQEPVPQAAAAPARHAPKTDSWGSGRASHASVPHKAGWPAGWSMSPVLMITMVLGLIAGMLAGHLVLNRANEGDQIPGPAPAFTTQTTTQLVLPEGSRIDPPNALPNAAPEEAGPSPSIPSLLQLPPESAPAQAQPSAATATATSIQTAEPSFQQPLVPTPSLTLEAPAVMPTPALPIGPPGTTPVPSSAP